MPDKQNDNKLMAMLERKGIVRKTDSEDKLPDSEPGAAPLRPEEEMRAIFGLTSGEAQKVTPAARQPVPGISNPILPSERPQESVPTQTRPAESRVVDINRAEPIRSTEVINAEQLQNANAPISGQPQSFRTPQQTVFSGGDGSLSGGSPGNEYFESAGEFDAPEFHQRTREDDYTDKYLEIDELYEVLSLKSKRTDTIYLVEEYLKSLPESLPDESRREIVGKIVTASGFDYDLLMGDGVLRVKMLKEYAERFADNTEEYVNARQAELDELDQQILRIRKLIDNRRELHKKQFFAIETEAQRLKDILTFISG